MSCLQSAKLFTDSGRYFPFITVLTTGRGENIKEYFQLRNTNGTIVFTTDQDGMDVLFGGGATVEDPDGGLVDGGQIPVLPQETTTTEQ